MNLSPSDIEKLQKARKTVGSKALLRAFIDTHKVDGDRIQAMMDEQGVEGAFDAVFGIQASPVADTVSPEPVPEKLRGASGLKAERSNIAVPLPKSLEREMQPIGFATSERLSRSVNQMAKSRKLPPELLIAIIKQESNFDPLAKSKVGAVGLMQLMPAAAKQSGLTISKGKDEREEPMRNIQAGLDYLVWLRDTYKLRSLDDLLGAYNAGPARLKDRKYQKIRETSDYIGKVKASMASYKKSPESMNQDLAKLHSAVKHMALKEGM